MPSSPVAEKAGWFRSLFRRMPYAYWFKSGDGMVSIVIRKPVDEASSDKTLELAREVIREAESMAAEVSKECGVKVSGSTSSMANVGDRCEMVGTVNLEYHPGMSVFMQKLNISQAR